MGDETGIVTILLGDVEGSTARWDADTHATATALRALHAEVDRVVVAHGGTRPVEQGEGDSFVALFPSPLDAVAAALDLQEDGDARRLRLRLGAHTGTPERLGDGRLGGPVLNRCARIRDLGHGGQTLLSTATRELVVDALPDGVTLVDRGLHRLRGLARPEHVWEVRPAGIAEEFPTLRSVGARPGNLPAELDPFIGRAVEQADLIRLLTAERLVTLTGAGGCGKTRLAIRVAAGVQDRFEGGVWFADLARVTEADELVGFVAGIVDADPALGRSAVDSIAAKLAGSPSLLLLDNCEHVVGAAAALVESLVGAATGLAVLTTSREPLGVPGEVAWRVPSLSTPDAVALFADRGARVRPGFVVEAELVDVVASICERLDGIPLAIELAAARVRAMSPASIAAGIADRFRLLVGGDRAVPRHRTLAASVEWSHSLLSDSEKALLRRLSTFVGGFTLDAAEAVAAASDLDRSEVLDLITRLVDRSLVTHDIDVHGADRYRMLETIRHFASERLIAADEATGARDRHMSHYLTLVEAAEPHISSGPGPWFDRVEPELANALAAVEWALASGQTETALRLAAASEPMYRWRGRPAGGMHVDRVLAATREASPELRGKLMATHAIGCIGIGQHQRANELAQRALDLVDDLGSADWHWVAHMALGEALLYQGDLAGARRHFLVLIDAGESATLQPAEPAVLVRLAMVAEAQGDMASGRKLADQAVLSARRLGRADTLGYTMFWAILPAGRNGDFAAMRALAGELVALAERLQDPLVTTLSAVAAALMAGWEGRWTDVEPRVIDLVDLADKAGLGIFDVFVHHFRAVAAAGETRLADATMHAEEALRLVSIQEQKFFAGWVSSLLGEVALARGDDQAAAAVFEAGRAESSATGDEHYEALNRRGLAAIARRRGDLDGAARTLVEVLSTVTRLGGCIDGPDTLEMLAGVLVEAGRAADGVRFVAAADAERGRIGTVRSGHRSLLVDPDLEAARAALSDGDFDAAWAEGAALSLEEAVAWATRGFGTRLRPPTGWNSLTPTELEVARLVAEGLNNPGIAARLFVSRNTVKTHVSHIFDKLGVTSRAELAAEVTRHTSH